MTVCERPPGFPHGGWTVAVSTLHVRPCVWISTRWDVLGQFLENQLPSSNGHGQQLDLAFPCRMWPTSARVQSSAEWSGCPWAATSHAPGPAGHIGQRARAGVWDFWLFSRALSATLSLRCTGTLCSTSARGGGMI